MTGYYFGCVRVPGHYWFNQWMQNPKDDFLPVIDGVYSPMDSDKEGVAQLVYLKLRQYGSPYTLISFWDRSVDSRGGCNSNFLIEGILSFEEAKGQSKAMFPTIWSRYAFDVTQWAPSPPQDAGKVKP